MSTKIENLYPEKVFHYFNEISKIPRGSKNEKKISDWLLNFAKERNLEVVQDDVLNILIKKPATKGYEDYSPLILQGHMDMVWEKNKETKFDFETQGIELKIEDGFLKANGTTLGADNGIAVAYALAILDSNDIKHPALEVIITTDEEDGMTGVNGLDYSLFKGKTLINLDTEEYGQVYVSSAGGGRTTTTFSFDPKPLDNKKYTLVSIEVKGLTGGHSGAEIHLGLGNANKILGDVLYHLSKAYTISINYIDGGDKVNAIPREAVAHLGIDLRDEESFEKFERLLKYAFDNILLDNRVIDKNAVLEVKKLTEDELLGSKKRLKFLDTLRLIAFLREFPNGVSRMSENIKGLVETSINLGVIKTTFEDEKIIIKAQSLPRSSVNSSLEKLFYEVEVLSKKHVGKVTIDSSYPSWEYKRDSKIREIILDSFKELNRKRAEVKAIHAGLECGIFANNIENLDIVSIGPNIYGAHTPEERMEIESVGKTWELILKVLENYNIK